MEDRQAKILKLTEQLVEFKSTNGNEKEIEACLEFIEEYFSGPEFVIKRHEYDRVSSTVISFKGDEDPELMLHGHIDVIEASDDMFETERNEGELYGRGTADMKAGVAALMQVMKDLKADKPSIGLMITSDEEVGGFKGAKKLFKEYSPSFAVSAEPNNIDGYLDIITDQKGVLRLKISVKGLSAHGSRPWNGENAAEKLMEKWPEIKDLFSDHRNGEAWVTTVNLGKLNAGESTNKVPEAAEAWLDIRTAEEYPNKEVIRDMEKIEGLEVEVLSDETMLHTSSDNNHVKALKKSAERVVDECKISRKEPASDMRHASKEGIPAVVFGPEGYNAHAPNEYTNIESLGDYYSIMMEFIQENFSKGDRE